MSPSKQPTTATRTKKSNGQAQLQKFLDAETNVKFVRFSVIDQVGVNRTLILPVKSALRIAEQGFLKAPVSPMTAALTITSSIVRENLHPEEMRLEPDWMTVRVCHWYPTHAMVMCFGHELGEEKPLDGYALCPRSQLIRQVEAAGDMEFLVGWEIELLIMDADKTTTPPAKSGGMSSGGYRNKFMPIMDEIVIALIDAGVEVYKYHTEEPFEGFFELVLMPLAPLEAADTFVYCHETIKAIASNHQMKATMHPSPFEASGPRIGSHVHFSISKPEFEDNFVAGLLEALPALAAFASPNYDSIDRTKNWKWVTFGHENKACIVRRCDPGHWEFRLADGTMNPYLVLSSFIIAGMDGVRGKKITNIKSLPRFEIKLTDEDREKYGVQTRMPRGLAESLDALEENATLKEGFGPELIATYLSMKRREEEDLGAMSAVARRATTMQQF